MGASTHYKYYKEKFPPGSSNRICAQLLPGIQGLKEILQGHKERTSCLDDHISRASNLLQFPAAIACLVYFFFLSWRI